MRRAALKKFGVGLAGMARVEAEVNGVARFTAPSASKATWTVKKSCDGYQAKEQVTTFHVSPV